VRKGEGERGVGRKKCWVGRKEGRRSKGRYFDTKVLQLECLENRQNSAGQDAECFRDDIERVRAQVLFATSIAQNIAYGAVGAKARYPLARLAPSFSCHQQGCLVDIGLHSLSEAMCGR
jgi:hypothetical protein